MGESQHYTRWMLRRDMPEVVLIEQHGFEYPWSEKEFVEALQGRNCVGQVATSPTGEITGYVVYELASQHIEIANISVAKAWRRQGVGSALVGKVVAKLARGRRERVLARVSDGNLEAHCFLRACGFRATAVESGCYDDSDDDAYLFEVREAAGKP